MSSDRQRSDDESPSTSSGSSDADQRDPAAPEPEEQEERKPSATQQKKNTKLSSKTTAKLSTSAKRIQKELAEITLDPPPNCRFFPSSASTYVIFPRSSEKVQKLECISTCPNGPSVWKMTLVSQTSSRTFPRSTE
uniref:Ubiquitin conjugating enzyme E2 E3 n=1 Tax=Ailuropoda melanoleuca TaxID=9646 RepID=A0A7N5KLN7_AILME